MDLEEVVVELAPRLLAYGFGRSRDHRLAEEIAQDALTALVVRWRRLGPPESAEAFAFAVARRRAWRLVLKRRVLLPLDGLPDREDPAPGPHERALEQIHARRVAEAIGRLRRPDREVLLLMVGAEVKSGTAAKLLGISRSALRMRLARARERLRTALEDGHGNP